MRPLSFLKQIGSPFGQFRRAITGNQRERKVAGFRGLEQLENRRLLVNNLVNFLTTEHVDINLQRTGAVWSLGPRNSDEVPPVQYANDQAVMYVGKPALESRPSGADYNFVGVGGGENFYVLPMSQNPALLYQGFAAYGLEGTDVDRYNAVAESKGRVTTALPSRWAKATLTGLRHTNPDGTAGAGQFSLWQTGSFGNPNVFMSSYNDGVSNANASGLDVTDGITADDALWITRGGHLHYNFGFTQPGRYEIDLKLSAFIGDDGLTTPNAAGFSQSQDITIYFSVMSVGQLLFDASSYSVNEDAGTASVNVVRIGGSDGRITVNYVTSNGTATAGSDYVTATGTLEFMDGETTKSISIPLLDDLADEPNETVNLTLNTAAPQNINEYLIDIEGDTNGLLGSTTTAVLTIVDNEEPANTPPTISDVLDRSTDEDTATGAIAFVVGDAQTAAGSLSLSATSSNTTLVPNANIVVDGSGASRTVTITPALNQFGSTTITLTVTDAGGLTATDSFLLTVISINDLPTISDVANQSTDEDTATGAIPFSVSDVETAAGALTVTATSSDLTLVPNANIVIGGSGANRTVTITPAANLTGSTTITLTVTDASGLTAADNFVLTVGGVNDTPTISDVSNQSTNEGTSTGAIAFVVGDLETPADSLVVTASSSNPTLVPNENIVLGGSGTNRTVSITPAGNLSGNTTIVLTVTDAGGLTAVDSFLLTVNAVNDLPTISKISNRFVLEGNSTDAIPFTVGDIETAAVDLVVTATSSNQTVIPDANIVLGGSGANRTISLTSIANQVGTSTITVTVTDASGGQASDMFVLTVGDLVRATFDRSAVIVNATQPLDVRLADIDNDGDLDVLFAKYITSISILPNNGNGTFGAEIALSALTVSDIHIADINGDSLPDIVSSVYIDSTYAETAIAVWRNLGGGSFSGRELVESTRTTGFVGLTGVGDVDGDGLKDLVLNQNGLSWSRNLGSGTFGSATSISTGGINYSSVLQDIDQDGDLDIIEATFINDNFRLQVFRNSGATNPGFATQQVDSFGGVAIRNIAIGDTNQDGFVDIHLLRGGSNRDIVALHGTSAGTFLAPVVLGSGTNLTDLKIGDIDGDGRPDLALTARERNQVHFAQNLGNGVFTELQEFTHDGSSLNASPETVAIGDIDRDGRNDLVFSERFGTGIAWSRNRSEENITALTPPAQRTYLNGYPMTFDVFLGFNVQVNTLGGSPTLPVTIGSQIVQVPYIGQPNANVLRFRYQVQGTDLDLDGVQVATSIALNGAELTDVHNRPIDTSFVQFPGVNTSGILVNGGAPYVTGITRLNANPVTSSTVRFEVTFSETVAGVTIDDFALDANGPASAVITAVAGSGNRYVVTSSIGTGDGTLRLRVLDDDSIVDADSYQLGGNGLGNGEFAYGQGYTIRTSTATPTFNNVITDGHLDVVLYAQPGDWYAFWYGAGWWETNDTLISAGADARATRPSDPTWDFLGTAPGETVWIFPETFSATTPWPGVGAYFNNAGDFASYFEADPRVNGTAPWIKMQLLDVRGPAGGEFSLYQSGITAPNVFMSSVNGIGPEDTAWIPNLDHIHYNWAFSKPGLYQVDIAASGYIDANQSGTYEPGIDLLSESQIITLHFGVELKPTISDINDRFVYEGNSTPAIPFTITDIETPGTDLVISATSSNQAVIPNGNIVLDGSGTNRTIRLTSIEGQIGVTTITVTVTDAAGLQSSETFDVSVIATPLVPFALPRVIGNGVAGVSNVNIADLDADGKLDVLTGAYGANKVVWYKGSGDGTFGAEQVIDATAAETWFNTHGDLDGDGDVDVLAGMYSGTLAWYANNGSGSFVKNVLATDIAGPYVRIGDLNGDGRNDILAGPDGGTTIFYFQQLPTGGFAARQVLVSSLTKLGGIHLNDFDFDGDLDVFAGDYGSNEISWFVNNGAGGLGTRQFVTAQDSSGLDRLVDLTGDGLVDLLSLEYATGRVSYYPQVATGGFGGRVAIPLTVSDSYALAVADFDNDGDNDIADGAYGSAGMIAWVANQGNGTFKPQLQVSTSEGQVSSMTAADLDSDGDADLVVGSFSGGRVSIYKNRLNEFATEIVQPASGVYLLGQKLDTAIHFGYPVTVAGTPSIALQIGSQTLQATYLSGSGTPTLKFQYTVQGTDMDSDGVQLAALLISLNGGSIIDPLGKPVGLALPSVPFSGVLVNGNAPFANSITRAGAAHGANAAQVSFLVSFNEAVQDVDAGDFHLMTTGTLAGTSVASVSGTGASRTVVVNTGIGSGVLGLHVKSNATVADLSGNTIGRGYAGGEVYTIRRSPSFVIDKFYTAGHGDVQASFADEWLELKVTPDGFEYENDEVLIYGNADALTTRPAGARWDFLGVEAGQNLYVWSDNGAIPTVPEQGFSGELVPGGTVAAHEITDPRIANTGTYLRLQVVGMRSSEGGAYSVFTNDLASTRVWIATADGISSADSIWIQEGSHQHFNVAFSKKGYYEVDFVVSTFRDINRNGVYDQGLDPYIESGLETIYYGVDIPGGPIDYVVPSDNRPVAVDDTYAVALESVLRGNVLLNDADLDGDSLNAVVVAGATKGTLALSGNGSFIYTPGPAFNGSDSFTYRSSDGILQSDITTVTITRSLRPDFISVQKIGHVDIGVNFADGAWDLHIHDEETDTEYAPGEAQFYVGSAARVMRTGDAAGAAFDFLGVPAGSSLYVLPQTQNPELLFLGIGAEELADGLLAGNLASLRLTAVSGPGHVSLWRAGLTPTTPVVLMATSDGIGENDSLRVIAGSHQHLNFGFSKIGFYQVTFVASGIDAAGNATDSGPVTYYFQVGNTVDSIDVQNGQVQRSFVRNVDVVFDQEDLAELLLAGRVQVTKFDLNGQNPITLAASSYAATIAGDRLRLDFGSQGIGGNRNSDAGDGYYRIGIDIDGDGTADALKHFYRLLGDVNGDRSVNALDRLLVMRGNSPGTPSVDINGDGVVNSVDLTLVTRALGKKLKNGLWIDD